MGTSNAQNTAIANAETLDGAYPAGVTWNSLPVDYLRTFTVSTLLSQGLAQGPDKTAIDFMGRKTSFGELDSMVRKAASGLQKMGVEKGTKIGLYMPNTPYYPIMFLAALTIGATVVNFSPLYDVEELAAQANDSDTDFMITLDLKDFYDKSEQLCRDGVIKKTIKCDMAAMLPPAKASLFRLLKGKSIARPASNDHHITFEELTDNSGHYRKPKFGADDIAVLQYTGGTTGTPKGAMLTHFNLVANTHQISQFFGRYDETAENALTIGRGQEKILATLPYFHVYGMTVAMLSPLQMGNEIVMLPDARDIATTLKTIGTKKPTVAPLVPRLIHAIDEHPKTAWQALKAKRKGSIIKHIFNALTKYPYFKPHSLESIRGVVSGGAALPSATAESFEAMIGRKNVILQGYGLSETSPYAASNPGHGKNKLSSVGLACPGTEIKIADPEDPDTIMDIGEMGEICIRGPQVFKGYYNKPDETAQTLTKDGWFRTGDLGHMDKDMYVHITDRKKRMIIVNGENVYPNQIEEKVTKLPDVAECVVVGLPDESAGEAAKLFVRFKNGATQPDEEAFRRELHHILHRAEMPKYITYSEEKFPETAAGKPDWNRMQTEEREKMESKAKSIGGQTPNPA